MTFQNKTVVITGASRGIGAATARHFVELGARVAMIARSETELRNLADELGPGALACPCDITNWNNFNDQIKNVEQAFGNVDILVNNAGAISPIARLEDCPPEGWANVIDVNMNAVFYGIRAVISGMKKQGKGRIINLSSGAARSPLEGWSHYCASKAGLAHLTTCADMELAEYNIRVIGLSPGTVATQMQREIKTSRINPVSQIDFETHTPPEYVAKAIAYLCGPAGERHGGHDFSIKTDEGRKAIGLPPLT